MYENQLQDLLEGPKEVETINQSCLSETKADTRPCTSVASSAAVESVRFKIVPYPPYSPVWHHLDFGCLQLSRNISKEFISHVMRKFKLLWENGF